MNEKTSERLLGALAQVTNLRQEWVTNRALRVYIESVERED